VNDLEERIQAVLHERVNTTAIRAMPPGTRLRIRSRQTGAVLVAFATAMAFSVVAFELFSTPLGGSRPANGENDVEVVPAPHGPDGSEMWNDVDPPAPGEWPSVTHGDLSDAYVDRTEAEEASFVVDKTAIDAGRVQDEPWSLVALEQNGNGAMWSDASPGPCGELFLGSWGDDGGGSFCLRLDRMEGAPEMATMGIVWGVGPITAYAGVATSKVDRIEIDLVGGESRRVPLVGGPGGMRGGYFVVFVPNGARGSVLAYGASSEVIEQQGLCAAQLEVPADATGTCGNGLVSSSSPVVSGP
jgi:hypothetical protein